MSVTELTPPPAQPLYRTLADHYLGAIRSGVLAPGERMPSVRMLMRTHAVSLSTALQVCRHLEAEGWLEARERSGYFVRQPRRALLAPDRSTCTVACCPRATMADTRACTPT
jgi:DNA-binding transcriptional MocR family regulator